MLDFNLRNFNAVSSQEGRNLMAIGHTIAEVWIFFRFFKTAGGVILDY